MEDLKQKVFTALQNAVDNGYSFSGIIDEEVAVDVLDHCSDLEGLEVKDIVKYVKLFVWTPIIEKVKAFIVEGNFRAAQSQLNMFYPEIQSYIMMYLPTSIMREYDLFIAAGGHKE